MEKFLYELICVDNGVVQSTQLMTEKSAEDSNKWLYKQSKRFEWRKRKQKEPEQQEQKG